MLVLDRKVKEGFWIDGGIFVKVLDIGRRRVKLGIEAPGNVRIMREELRPRERPVHEELEPISDEDLSEEDSEGERDAESRDPVRSMRRRNF